MITGSRGAPEVHVGPDLPVLHGDLANPPDLQDLRKHVLTFGDAKVKHLDCSRNQSKILPGTVGCYESWLAQAVQCCIDLDISIGWVQTNLEVVIFHLSRCDDSPSQNNTVTTRSSKGLLIHIHHAAECPAYQMDLASQSAQGYSI